MHLPKVPDGVFGKDRPQRERLPREDLDGRNAVSIFHD
jgi:hypothetical protein